MKSSHATAAHCKPVLNHSGSRGASEKKHGGFDTDNLQVSAKSAKPFKSKMGWNRQTGPSSTYLPPISRPKGLSGKAAPPLQRKEPTRPRGHPTRLPTANMRRESTLFQVLVHQSARGNREFKKWNQISVAIAGGNKSARRLIKQTPGAQQDASLPPAQADPQRKYDAPVPAKIKHDACLNEDAQHRRLCSDDSAIESESSGSEIEGRPPEWLSGDAAEDYYTDERIAEWVLKVNASLFATDDAERTTKPTKEQDVATIKIVYSGD